jgi:hypothetical protein
MKRLVLGPEVRQELVGSGKVRDRDPGAKLGQMVGLDVGGGDPAHLDGLGPNPEDPSRLPLLDDEVGAAHGDEPGASGVDLDARNCSGHDEQQQEDERQCAHGQDPAR